MRSALPICTTLRPALFLIGHRLAFMPVVRLQVDFLKAFLQRFIEWRTLHIRSSTVNKISHCSALPNMSGSRAGRFAASWLYNHSATRRASMRVRMELGNAKTR